MEALLALGDGEDEFLDEYVLGLVVGEVELVEAGVGSGEPVLLELLVDVELLHAVHAPEVLEALHRHPRAARHELQEGGPEFHVEALEHLEEPGDDLVVFDVVDEFGVPAQVVDVDAGPPRDHDLQFLLVEDADEFVGDEFVEALQQRLQLVLYAGRHLRVGTQLHVLQLVLLGHQHLLAARHQLLCLDLAEVVEGVGEVEF